MVAIQHGRPIFNLSASFQIQETGLDYQEQIPAIPPPEKLDNVNTYLQKIGNKEPQRLVLGNNVIAPFELKPVEPLDLDQPQKRDPYRHIWLRTIDKLPDDPDLHRSLLAYISDFSLLDTNLLPHALRITDPQVQIASIDHALWFHRDFRIDQWLLYACESVSASGARGLSRGRFFTLDGTLVASTMQEGMIRIREQGMVTGDC